MNAERRLCIACPLGKPRDVYYAQTWRCPSPDDFRESAVIRDGASLGKANAWCPFATKKECLGCLEWKDTTEFSPHNISHDKLQTQCKVCRNKKQASSRSRGPRNHSGLTLRERMALGQ